MIARQLQAPHQVIPFAFQRYTNTRDHFNARICLACFDTLGKAAVYVRLLCKLFLRELNGIAEPIDIPAKDFAGAFFQLAARVA